MTAVGCAARVALALGVAGAAGAAPPSPAPGEARPGASKSEEQSRVKIALIIDGETLTATLDDSAAARAFAALLPLELTLSDYAQTEKVSDLPAKLTTAGAPAGYASAAGDLTYYAPWGNLAIFYRGFRYSTGLVRLGRFDGGVEALARRRGAFAARVERVGGR